MKRRQLVDADFVRAVEWTPELLARELGGSEVYQGQLHEIVGVVRLEAISERLAQRLLEFHGEPPPIAELFELVLRCGLRLTVWPNRPWACMDVRSRCHAGCSTRMPKGRSTDPGWWDGEASE